jgi:hypothetical protein
VVTFSLLPGAYLHRSAVIYVGIAGFVLAAGGLAVSRASWVRVAIAVVGLAGVAFSLRPGTSVLGTHPSMPSQLVYDVIPYYRVFGRLEIFAALAVGARLGGEKPGYTGASAALQRAGVGAIVVHPPAEMPAGTGFVLARRFQDGSVGYVLAPARG